MGDGCLSVAVVVATLLTVATAAESLLLAAKASPLIQVRRLVMTHNCDPFTITATFGVMLSCSSALSLLFSSLSLSFLVLAEVPSVVVVV